MNRLQAAPDQVLAFRLASHNLARRLPAGALLEAAAACGLQNTPPGSAALALNARVQDTTAAAIDHALATDKTLLQVRSLRTAPHVVPTRDAAVFTAGLLPEDEESLRFFIRGAGPALDAVGLSATTVVEYTAAELLVALDGRVLTFRQLSTELTERVARRLVPRQLAGWQSPSWYGPNQCLGEAIVHFALSVVALQGLFCYAPRAGDEASFVRTDQWLGGPLPPTAPDAARTELLRRYLSCYGPSTVEHFAAWAGIAPAAAQWVWRRLAAELVAVDFAGRETWLHRRDLAAFASPPQPTGVRLLPPHDPYLAQRDRETLLPEGALRRQVWRPVGNPGIVLAAGRLAALWRPQKKGRRLLVAVTPFTALPGPTRSEIAAEVALLAPLRGCAMAETIFTD